MYKKKIILEMQTEVKEVLESIEDHIKWQCNLDLETENWTISVFNSKTKD